MKKSINQLRKVNFLLYKNKPSTNNHKISNIFSPKLCMNKPFQRSTSNIHHKLNIPFYKTLSFEENNLKENLENPSYQKKKSLEEIKKKSKTLTKYEYTPNIDNNLVDNKFYYNFICLGKEVKKAEINKILSPSLKYFLYNISERNKKQKLTIKSLFQNYNTSKYSLKKKFIHPNYSLIDNNLKIKYKNLLNLPHIIRNKYSPIVIKSNEQKKLDDDEEDKSDGNSSFENNYFNSYIDQYIKKNLNEKKNEEIKNENKTTNKINISSIPFFQRNNLKQQKEEFLRIKNKALNKLNFSNNIKNKIPIRKNKFKIKYITIKK